MQENFKKIKPCVIKMEKIDKNVKENEYMLR